MADSLTEILVERIRDAIVDVPPSEVVAGIVEEVGLEEVVDWMHPLAKKQGYKITIERII